MKFDENNRSKLHLVKGEKLVYKAVRLSLAVRFSYIPRFKT